MLVQCYKTKYPKYCSNWEYAPSVSYKGVHASNWTAPDARSLADLDVVKSDLYVTSMSIYFDAMQYVQYREQPLITFNEFICNIGGTWGLWTGVSIVGLVQCCYIIICGHWEPDEDDKKAKEKKGKEAEQDITPPSIATVQDMPPVSRYAW